MGLKDAVCLLMGAAEGRLGTPQGNTVLLLSHLVYVIKDCCIHCESLCTACPCYSSKAYIISYCVYWSQALALFYLKSKEDNQS